MAGKRKSELEIQKRIDEVIDQMLTGLIDTSDLLGFIRREYGVSNKQGEIYIRRAKEQLQQIGTDWEKSEQKALAIKRYNLLFNKNFILQDYREARQVQSQLDKILGNEAPKRKEITGADGGAIEMKNNSIPVSAWAEKYLQEKNKDKEE